MYDGAALFRQNRDPASPQATPRQACAGRLGDAVPVPVPVRAARVSKRSSVSGHKRIHNSQAREADEIPVVCPQLTGPVLESNQPDLQIEDSRADDIQS